MGKRILNELKQWTKGEIVFYSIVFTIFTLIMSIAGAILDFRVHYIIFGIFTMIAFIFVAKRTFIGYILIVVAYALYAIFAYINNYFSEIFAGVLFILPYVVVETIRWIKQKTNKPKLPQGKALVTEIILTILFASMLFYGAYKILYVMQNSWLLGSTCAIVAAALFLYFTTFAERVLSHLFLTVYLGLASTCWVFCAVFTDISYAAIALAMIAATIMSLRLFINNTKAFVRARKASKQANTEEAEESTAEDEKEQPSENKKTEESKEIKAEKEAEEKETKEEKPTKKAQTKKTSDKESKSKKEKTSKK